MRDLSPDQWLALANSRLPTVLSGVLVLVLAWYLARLFWAVLPGQPEYDWSVAPQPVAMSATAAPATFDFAKVADAHLFGEADAAPPPEAAVDAPETRLNLKLRGTIAADDETIAHAIISEGGNQAKVYFIEDSVPGGATLHEVRADRVILKRGGAFETLKLPKQSLSLGSPPSLRSEVTGSDEHGSGRSTSLRDIQSNPASFTEIIRPQPYMPNGELKGYRVYPGRDRRTFSALGLRPGDLVTDINGQPLDNLQSGMEVFRSLANTDQLTVTIERNGAAMVLTLDTNEFNNAAGAMQ